MSSNHVAPLEIGRKAPPAPSAPEIAAWAVLAAAILFILMQHLVSAAIVGLTLFVILDRVSERFASGRLSRTAVRPLALLFVALATAALITIAFALIATMLRRGAGNIPDMLNRMAEILGSVRIWLGGLGQQFIPEVMTDAEDLKATIAKWLKEHAQQLRAGGLYIGIGLLHMIMGGLLALLVFFRHLTHREDHTRGPFAYYLLEKTDRFADSFARVAAAQIKISAVNTTLTGIYLLVILPLFGLEVPFATTLVLITFICGLIPVLGNLISNTFITILSMGVTVGTAFASLAFLVIIHKLEYLINSRIVGGETDSQAWEILLAIIIGEAAFGVGGIVLAPIIYAFIKRELRERALV
ncbi:MAG: AI-2E family transporter [Thermoanaerobaculia bacterium]|nr:AI-2E family transporter [Thermoanaerobaculia bacterium]